MNERLCQLQLAAAVLPDLWPVAGTYDHIESYPWAMMCPVREFRPMFAFLAALFAGLAGEWIVCVGFALVLLLSADDVRYLSKNRLRPDEAKPSDHER